MTQRSEADDRKDDAAADAANHDVHKYRQDLPDEGAAPTEMRTDLARLESAFPAFSFMICNGWDGPRIEA
jgi:hypothetical protein